MSHAPAVPTTHHQPSPTTFAPYSMANQLGGNSSSAGLDGSYSALCGALPPEMLRPCLVQLMEVVARVLASYHAMSQWHDECVEQQRAAAAAAATEAAEAAAAAADSEAVKEAMAAQAASNTTLGFLVSVAEMLGLAKVEVFQAAARRVFELLSVPGLFSGQEGLPQVAEACSRFMAMGEAFCGQELPPMRAAVGHAMAGAFEALHRASMEQMSVILQNEQWKAVEGGEAATGAAPAPGGGSAHTSSSGAAAAGDATTIGKLVAESPLFTPGERVGAGVHAMHVHTSAPVTSLACRRAPGTPA